MGMIFSALRTKRTTVEILEDLDSKIKEIEEYGQNTEQRLKKIIGRLVVYSIILYITLAFIFYFYFFPASLYDQIFYITPLLIFPILILFTKKLVSWYYKRKISYNKEKLTAAKQKKKKILDKVIETETYKKAKEILLKFAPDQLNMTPLSPQTSQNTSPKETPRELSTPKVPVLSVPGTGDLRKRVILSSNPQENTPASGAKIINTTPMINRAPPLPRPIVPQHRSYLDRLVDYLIGDGPSNRYALICRQCECHNGMSLKEEFEYFGFRCCYCNFWNPPKKQKPGAPKLDLDNDSKLSSLKKLEYSLDNTVETTSLTEVVNSSDTDSDIEVVEKPVEAPKI